LKQYDPKLPLISIHIPKCAGASFHVVLRKWFGRKLLLHYHDEKKDKRPRLHPLRKGLIQKKMRPNICIHGHFNHTRGNGTGEYYPEVDQFISVMRNPLEIHLSNYFYLKKLGKNAYRNGKLLKAADPDYTIEHYFQDSPKSYLLSFLPNEINHANYRDIIQNKFVYICLSEDFQTSIDRLAEKLGRGTVKVPTYNISPRKETLSDELKEKFIAENQLEFDIFNYIKEIYATA